MTDDQGATGSAVVTITASAGAVVNAPSSLTRSVSRTGVVTLQWIDNSTNEEGFYVERAPRGSTSFVRVGRVSANVTTYSEQPGKGWYTYRVQAYNATTGRLSAYSNSVTARVG